MDYEKDNLLSETRDNWRIGYAKKLLAFGVSEECRSALEKEFPELKEGEDERIRNEIIEFIDWAESRGSVRNDWHQKKRPAEWIAYLEKQKDQDVKVISWREPDDCADIPEGHYVVIAYKPGVFGLGYIGNGKVVCAPGQKPSGILYIPNADESIIVESKEQQPAEYIKRNSKEWYSLLAEQWDKGFWKGKAEQKPAQWSEEDEKWIDRACMLLNELNDLSHLTLAKIPSNVDEIIAHIKSLRPKPHWKPSEEQMRCLLDCVSKAKEIHNASVGGYDAYRILVSLYDELHKLL